MKEEHENRIVGGDNLGMCVGGGGRGKLGVGNIDLYTPFSRGSGIHKLIGNETEDRKRGGQRLEVGHGRMRMNRSARRVSRQY